MPLVAQQGDEELGDRQAVGLGLGQVSVETFGDRVQA
jgi:hypothetical protein